MVMTLREIFQRLTFIVEALEKEDYLTAKHEACRLRDFMRNAHIMPLLSTEQ